MKNDHALFQLLQIADFGMSRDLSNMDYYVSHGGQVPIKWTAPEVYLYKYYLGYIACML